MAHTSPVLHLTITDTGSVPADKAAPTLHPFYRAHGQGTFRAAAWVGNIARILCQMMGRDRRPQPGRRGHLSRSGCP